MSNAAPRSTLTAMSSADLSELDAFLPRHADFPRAGITFIDVLPLFTSPSLRSLALDALADAVRVLPTPITLVAGFDARGFLFVSLAERLGLPFVCLRKAGKLPGEKMRVEYALEYGTASLEVSVGAIPPAASVILVDDLLATGGTARAGEELVKRAGATPAALAVLVEIEALGGAASLSSPHVITVLRV